MGRNEEPAATKDAPTLQKKEEYVLNMGRSKEPAAMKDAPTSQ